MTATARKRRSLLKRGGEPMVKKMREGVSAMIVDGGGGIEAVRQRSQGEAAWTK